VREVGASRYTHTARFDYAGVNAALRSLDERLDAFADTLAARGLTECTRTLTVEARYAGQIWEIELPLRVQRFANEADVAAFIEDFHAEHERVFAVRDPDNPVECIHWRARLTAALPRGSQTKISRERKGALVAQGTRTAHFGGLRAESHLAAVHYGEALRPGDRIDGPAIIEEPTTTLVVYPGASARVTAYGHYLCELASAPGV